MVFEHVTTREAADYVREADAPDGTLGATITPQHLLYNRNAIFTGGLRPHWYCLPVLKRETHRQALVAAATSGSPRFFLGTDSAPHARAPQGARQRLRRLLHRAARARAVCRPPSTRPARSTSSRRFASRNGPAFYRLPVNKATVTLQRQPWTIPAALPFGDGEIVPLARRRNPAVAGGVSAKPLFGTAWKPPVPRPLLTGLPRYLHAGFVIN